MHILMFHFPENLRIFYIDFSSTQKLLSKILNNSQILGNFVVSRFFPLISSLIFPVTENEFNMISGLKIS